MFPKKLPELPKLKEHPPSVESSDGDDDVENLIPSHSKAKERSASGQLSQHSKFGSKGALHSPVGSMHSFDLQVFTTESKDLHIHKLATFNAYVEFNNSFSKFVSILIFCFVCA